MTLSSFQKGALLGALGVLALEVVVVIAWSYPSRDEPPDPTATRREVRGIVTETDPRLCVASEPSTDEKDAVPVLDCGLALQGVASHAAVGDDVVGEIVEIELDPGSGPAWVLWSSVGPSAE